MDLKACMGRLQKITEDLNDLHAEMGTDSPVWSLTFDAGVKLRNALLRLNRAKRKEEERNDH